MSSRNGSAVCECILDRTIDQGREMASVVRYSCRCDARNSQVQSRLRPAISGGTIIAVIYKGCNVVTMQVELPKHRHVPRDLPMPLRRTHLTRVTGIQPCSRGPSRFQTKKGGALSRGTTKDDEIAFGVMAVIADVPPLFQSIQDAQLASVSLVFDPRQFVQAISTASNASAMARAKLLHLERERVEVSPYTRRNEN